MSPQPRLIVRRQARRATAPVEAPVGPARAARRAKRNTPKHQCRLRPANRRDLGFNLVLPPGAVLLRCATCGAIQTRPARGTRPTDNQEVTRMAGSIMFQGVVNFDEDTESSDADRDTIILEQLQGMANNLRTLFDTNIAVDDANALSTISGTHTL